MKLEIGALYFLECTASTITAYLHSSGEARSVQKDWQVTEKLRGSIHSVIKRHIRMEVFYLKVWITLLNEMLQLLFMPWRHLCGYFLAV